MSKSWKETERECLSILQEHSFWCHLFANDVGGQPCDIVAIHKSKSFLLDVKHCVNNRFELRRIEPNQWNCFEYVNELDITCGFVIYFEEVGWKWLDFQYVLKNKHLKSIRCEELEDFETWLGEQI